MLGRLSLVAQRTATPARLARVGSRGAPVVQFQKQQRRGFAGGSHHHHEEQGNPDFKSAFSTEAFKWGVGMLTVAGLAGAFALNSSKNEVVRRDAFRQGLSALVQNPEVLFTVGDDLQIVGTPQERIRGDRALYSFTLAGSKAVVDVKFIIAHKNRQYIVTYLSYQPRGEAITTLVDFDSDLAN